MLHWGGLSRSVFFKENPPCFSWRSGARPRHGMCRWCVGTTLLDLQKRYCLSCPRVPGAAGHLKTGCRYLYIERSPTCLKMVLAPYFTCSTMMLTQHECLHLYRLQMSQGNPSSCASKDCLAGATSCHLWSGTKSFDHDYRSKHWCVHTMCFASKGVIKCGVRLYPKRCTYGVVR